MNKLVSLLIDFLLENQLILIMLKETSFNLRFQVEKEIRIQNEINQVRLKSVKVWKQQERKSLGIIPRPQHRNSKENLLKKRIGLD